MSRGPQRREMIPGGEQEVGYGHLLPIAKLLIERGHLPISETSTFGFSPTPAGMICSLARRFTDEDWAAINARFVIPPNIVYFHGLIRDHDNWVDMMGAEEIICPDGPQSVDVWEACERQAGRVF